MKYQVGDMLVCNGVFRKEIYLVLGVKDVRALAEEAAYQLWNFQYNCRDAVSIGIEESCMWEKL